MTKNTFVVFSAVMLAASGLGLSPTSMAAGSSGAQLFSSNCASCHGTKGQGTPGLAPALKGNPFVLKGDEKTLEKTIKNGRQGDAKKYPNIPIAMPAWNFTNAQLHELVEYLKGPLQKR